MKNNNLKFRVWDKLRKHFLYHHQSHGYFYIDLNGEFYNFHNSAGGYECVVQQWTGFLDKNKKEIYVGDIVRIQIDDNPEDLQWELYEISSWICGFLMDETNRFKWLFTDFILEDNILDLEIVGNVFGNPELNIVNQQKI